MASLSSIKGEMQLSLRLLARRFDPFQKDLEWFDYELAVEGQPLADAPGIEPAAGGAPLGRAVRGKINRKDLNALLGGLDELVAQDRPMRFEPCDLNYYLEWSHETPLVYLIVTWFDAALASRRFDQRFPSAHVGFRFLAEHDALLRFRRALDEESSAARQTAEPSTLLQ